MYATDYVYPAEEAWVADRLVQETGATAIAEQKTSNIQRRVITLMCAKSADVADVMRALQDDADWHHNIQNGCAPTQEGLDLFRGQINCQRYLPLIQQDRGYYKVGVTSL